MPGRIRPCPKPFTFKTPEGTIEEGTVHEEKLVEYLELEDRDYYKVVQLLEWKDDGWSIRFGYYLRPHGASDDEWTWGSQTTLIVNIDYLDDVIEALKLFREMYNQMELRQKET